MAIESFGDVVGHRLAVPRVCVLGEPKLASNGDDLLLTGQPAHVLVALVAAETALSLDQLADMVWTGRPPKSARAALHVHLGALRKLLASAPPGLAVDRLGDRYSLSRSGWELDVDLVHALVGRGRALLAADQRAAAAVDFESAVDMWSGEAYTVAGEEVSATAAHRLHLLRLDIEEQLVESLLLAGEPVQAEVLGVRFVDAAPYRELRWAQLMRALTAQGRAAEALATYQRIRQILDTDLGVEPGEELNRLERSVLTRDSLAAGVATELTSELGEIPGVVGELIGRTELVDRAESVLAHELPVLLSGAPGAGKTRAAIELARRVSDEGRAVGWVDLRNAVFEDATLDDRVARWARRNAGGLVVLDNAEQAVSKVAELVRVLHRAAPSVQVVVTSRVPIPGVSAVVAVDALTIPSSDDLADVEDSESVQLLRSLMALLAPGVELDSASASALCRRMGGLPLGIRLAAELARSVPVSEIAPASRERLGPDLHGAVTRSLEWAGPRALESFAAVSAVAGQLDNELAVALIGGDAPQQQISALVEHGLMQFAPGLDAPYSVPEPLREVGLAMLEETARPEVLARLADNCVSRAEILALPMPTTEQGQRLNDVLHRQLPWNRQTLDYLASVEDDQRAFGLVISLDLQLYSLGWWQENVELQEAALAIPGPPSGLRAWVHALRGRPGLFHQFDERHNRIALEMASAVGDDASLIRAEYHLGVLCWWERRYAEAIDWLDRARVHAEQLGDVFMIGESVRFTGMTLVSSGEFEQGLAMQLDLIQMVEQMAELTMVLPHLYMHLGHCRRHIGDEEAALADLERARAGFEELENRASLIHVCAGLAEVYADLGRHDRALEAASRSLAVSAGGATDVYDPWTLGTTARVHADTGDEVLARGAAAAAAKSLARTFDGETHRVAAQLAFVAHQLGESGAALRLAGLADSTPDRRELPFRSPGEDRRLGIAQDAARQALGDEADIVYERGATSNIIEAASMLLAHP